MRARHSTYHIMKLPKSSKAGKASGSIKQRLFRVSAYLRRLLVLSRLIAAKDRKEARNKLSRLLREVRLTVRPASLGDLLVVRDVQKPSFNSRRKPRR